MLLAPCPPPSLLLAPHLAHALCYFLHPGWPLHGSGASLPLEAVSYTQLANEWKGVQERGQSLIQLRASSSGPFEQCWTEKADELQRLRLLVRQCITEKSDDNPYRDGGAMVESISRILLADVEDGAPAHVFFNQAGGEQRTRPDVAWCGMSRNVSRSLQVVMGWVPLDISTRSGREARACPIRGANHSGKVHKATVCDLVYLPPYSIANRSFSLCTKA